MRLASSGSFVSSPRWTRLFSRMPIEPGSMIEMARAASGPWQSSTNRTDRPVSPASGRTSWAVDISGRELPLGRPKCDNNRTIAPLSLSSSTVGSIARSRVSSATDAPFIGTLRSTRTSTFLPVRSSGKSSSVLKAAIGSDQLGDRAGGVDHAVGEAPFIVVPADHADQLALDHRRFQAVDGRAGRCSVIVDRNQRLIAIVEDAGQRTALGGRPERGVDLFLAGIAPRREGQVDQADVGGRH